MLIEIATERILPGEKVDPWTHTLESYGHSFAVAGFGHRLIVDVVLRESIRGPEYDNEDRRVAPDDAGDG